MITRILPEMIPMRDISQISDGDRLFYELGRKINGNVWSYEDNWIAEGRFQEIYDVEGFIERSVYLTELKYLEHHNFMVIKNKNSMDSNKIREIQEENAYRRAEEFIKKYPYVDSFLSSAQGYEVLMKFMVEFSKSENSIRIKKQQNGKV